MWNNPYMQYPYNQNNQNGYQQPCQRTEIVKVNGEGGANAYRMAPNSQMLMLDETNPILWLKTTDGAGYATVTPYAITPYKPAPQVDVTTLEQRITKLEDIINGKSYSANVKRRKSEGEAEPSTDS